MSPDQINPLASTQPATFRAAQYVRMPTEYQQYSTNNQADKILEYAQRRNIEIVRTRGSVEDWVLRTETGKHSKHHRHLHSLSPQSSVLSPQHFPAYVAEQFENDGSPVSTIVKGVKRAMAGEYSRELSAKVFAGQCRLIELACRRFVPVNVNHD